MYDVHDTIAAVSSAAGTGTVRNIIRISGPKAFQFVSSLMATVAALPFGHATQRGISYGRLRIDNELAIEAIAYIFPSPHSYTGDDLAELHIDGPPALIEAVMQRLFALGARAAEAGEFTARAYLNGKMDLAQAEAVAQIIAGSNSLQLTAAQRLLAGRLTKSISDIQATLLDLMSRIEAGLDFSGEGIEFISVAEAIGHIDNAIAVLRRLLDGSVSCEEIIGLPSVGIVGASNAGKSSLLNALLQEERSIVSDRCAATRDVLTGILKLAHCNCAIFDCAGLEPPSALNKSATENTAVNKNTKSCVLEQLAQNSAIEAIHTAQLIIFCVDISKPSWSSDIEIFKSVCNKPLITVATKCDIPPQSQISNLKFQISNLFGRKFLFTSSTTGKGIESLLSAIDAALTSPAGAAVETADIISLNQRHRHRLENAIDCLQQAKQELMSDNEEVAAMLLRNGYRAFGELSDEGIDDAVLERIFSHFCIGK